MVKNRRIMPFMGFGKDMIKELTHRKPVTFSDTLLSPEFKRHFTANHSTAKVEHHPKNGENSG